MADSVSEKEILLTSLTYVYGKLQQKHARRKMCSRYNYNKRETGRVSPFSAGVEIGQKSLQDGLFWCMSCDRTAVAARRPTPVQELGWTAVQERRFSAGVATGWQSPQDSLPERRRRS